MTTHYHLLLTTPEPNLAIGMHSINGIYAKTFNRRHGEAGHVFERRYHSVLVEQEEHFLEVFRYLALNPVRAGICGRPEEWPWSSYPAAIGRVPPPPFLSLDRVVRTFCLDVDHGREALARFVSDLNEERRVA